MTKKMNFIKSSLIVFILISGIPYNLMAIPVSEATEVLEDIQKMKMGHLQLMLKLIILMVYKML